MVIAAAVFVCLIEKKYIQDKLCIHYYDTYYMLYKMFYFRYIIYRHIVDTHGLTLPMNKYHYVVVPTYCVEIKNIKKNNRLDNCSTIFWKKIKNTICYKTSNYKKKSVKTTFFSVSAKANNAIKLFLLFLPGR